MNSSCFDYAELKFGIRWFSLGTWDLGRMYVKRKRTSLRTYIKYHHIEYTYKIVSIFDIDLEVLKMSL